jgi:cyclophilin family peptidyl-prolyl cis-trans isomerase
MRYLTSLGLFLALLVAPVGHGISAQAADLKESIMLIELKSGTVKIALREDLAPGHVERMKTLINEKFYDGIVFHRVIDGFMAQTGDPTGTGMGGSDYPDLRAEFSSEPFRRGTMGMARSQHPDSANSQFFICFDDAGFLNGQYTVFGEVVEGMEHVDAIAKGEPPATPDKMISVRLED